MKIILSLICAFIMVSSTIAQPVDPEKMMLERANIYYKNANFDSALIFINKCIKMNKKSDELYFKRALIYEKVNKMSSAIDDYEKAIKLNPTAKYYNNLGVVYAIKSDYTKAKLYYETAINTDSTYAQAYLNLGVAYYYLKDMDNACISMKKASELGLEMANSFIGANCK